MLAATNRKLRQIGWRTFPSAMLVIRYIRQMRRLPHIRRPRSLTEKLLTRLLFDRNPRLTCFADKYAVRDYVKTRLGSDANLTALYAVIDEPTALRDLDLPTQFVMKPTHLTGEVKLVRNVETVNRVELEALAASWLRRNLAIEQGEWAYRNVPPRVMFEELLDVDGYPPADYKFHCFDGLVGWVSVFHGRFRTLTCDIYDADFRPLPVRFTNYPPSRDPQTEPPAGYLQMLDVARKLSAGVDYVRVDLYGVGQRVIFGELTNYPGAGLWTLDPPVWDFTFGRYWSLADYRDLRPHAPRLAT